MKSSDDPGTDQRNRSVTGGSAGAGAAPHIVVLVENLPLERDARVKRQCRALIDAGYRVSVICPRGDTDDAGIPGVAVYSYPPPKERSTKTGFLWEYGYSWVMSAFKIAKLIRTDPFQAVQACNPPDTYFLLVLPFKLLLRTPFVFDHHDLSPELYAARYGRHHGLLPAALRTLERGTFLAADHVIATNDTIRKVALDRGRKGAGDVTVVRNGPELERVRGRPRPEGRTDGGFLCCWVGVMGVDDGVDVALRALEELVYQRGRRDCQFLFMGDGESSAAMRDLAQEIDVGDWVRFTGWLSEEEVYDHLASADIGLAPDPKSPRSDSSTMMKVMEYMACGLPVVAFDVRETRVSAGDAGVYADADDIPAYARLIDELLDDPRRRASMGGSGRRKVETQLAWDHQKRAYVEMYDRLLGRNQLSSDRRHA